jgi:hypothetical protein
LLADAHLQHAQQLHYEIQTIETSMSTMLLPHLEICRTITTAYDTRTAAAPGLKLRWGFDDW